jgi:hypothetical protein
MEGGEVEAEERRRVAAEAAEEAVIEEAVERTAGELLSN